MVKTMNFQNVVVDNVTSVLRYDTQKTRWSARSRKDHIFGVKLAGNAVHRFADKTLVLEQNVVFFLNQREDYEVAVLEKGVTCCVHFTTPTEISTSSFCKKVKDVGEYVGVFEKIERLFTEMPSGSNRLRMAVYELLDKIWGVMEGGYVGKEDKTRTAKTYMDTHFCDKDCLRVAAEQSGVSRRRFNDLFLAQYGITPNRYLTARKIERAKQLLSQKGLTITQVALLCGFEEVYYFSKVFYDATGVRPSKW